jgi:membrane protease YdiL (CAAX protease family)
VVPTGAPPVPERGLSRRALVLTLVAIGVGAVAMGVSTSLAHDTSLSPATYLRYALVLTLGVYAVVGVLVVTQITPSVRLRWHDGSPALGVAIGLLVGGGLSAALLAAVSAAAGHLSPDPRIVTLMSEGDAPHVIATVLISCAAAPLIEEVLFRGLLLESQRSHGTRRALAVSAAAFAVWHLNPSALRYYALMGALLGFLYLRRGLACSIAAHVAFNGVLTVAALSVVLTPGPSVDVQGLTVQTPAGWHRATPKDPAVEAASADAAVFTGPSGAGLVVLALPTPVAPDVSSIVDRFATSGAVPAMLDRSSVRELRLPVGEVIEVSGTSRAQRVTLVVIPHDGRSYELVMNGAGSPKADRDFTRILQDLHVG